MVAIEYRQTTAIIATDTTNSTTTTTPSTPTQLAATTAISSLTTEATTNLDILAEATTTATSTPTSRRSSDIENSNDITVLSPISVASTNSSSTITVITSTETKTPNRATTPTTTKNIIVSRKDSKDNNQDDKERKLDYSLSPKMSQSSSEASTATAESATGVVTKKAQTKQQIEPAASKSAVSQRNVDIKIAKKPNKDAVTKDLTKKMLKLDISGKELDEYSIKSPKSPIATRLPHQSSLSAVDVEDRKTLREALYQGIFHRHRRTIFAVGSFLRMLRSRNSSYNTIRSTSEGEDVDETR